MTKNTATPRPWSMIYERNQFVIDAPHQPIGKSVIADTRMGEPRDEANAELIVRAVNAHDELVRACEAAQIKLFMLIGNQNEEYEMLAAALDKAKGK